MLKYNLSKYLKWFHCYFSSIPFYTIFYVTAQCNARCVHCFNWELIEGYADRNELSIDEIELIAKNWGRMLIVNLAGGEPYLRDDLPEIVRVFKKYTDVDIVAIPSNGFLTDRVLGIVNKLLERFPDIYFRLAFSVDGIGEQHDKIRSVTGGFEKVVRTIKEVKALKKKYRNFSLFTNSTFMELNQDDLMGTLKYIKSELDVDAMSMTCIRGDVKQGEVQEGLYNEKYKEVAMYLAKLNRTKFKNHPMANFIWGATSYAREKVFDNLKYGRRNFECYAIRKMIVVDDVGEVYICEMRPTSLGNLRDYNYDIKKIVRSKMANDEYKKIKDHQCNCTWECAIRTGIIFNPKEYLSLLRCMYSSSIID